MPVFQALGKEKSARDRYQSSNLRPLRNSKRIPNLCSPQFMEGDNGISLVKPITAKCRRISIREALEKINFVQSTLLEALVRL